MLSPAAINSFVSAIVDITDVIIAATIIDVLS